MCYLDASVDKIYRNFIHFVETNEHAMNIAQMSEMHQFTHNVDSPERAPPFQAHPTHRKTRTPSRNTTR